MEYHPNGWADLGQGTHVRYALGYTIRITEESIGSSKKYTHLYNIYMFSIYGVETIGQDFTLDAAKGKALNWLRAKVSGFVSEQVVIADKAWEEGYAARVAEEQLGYAPYEK